jgi:hypothetical protein
MISMMASMIRGFRSCWKALALTDILFKIVAFVLLTPLVGLLFRLFVAISGRTVLADVDSASFFVHPIGWVCLVVVAGAALGILALEQPLARESLLGSAAWSSQWRLVRYGCGALRSGPSCCSGRTVGLLTAVAAGDLTRAKADFLAVNVGLANTSFIRSSGSGGAR